MKPSALMDSPPTEENVSIPGDRVSLNGTLVVPESAKGVVLFAHGSGSSRHSPRNRFVARELQERGFATLLIDLLSQHEESVDTVTGHLRFDIPLLAERLTRAIDWLSRYDPTTDLPIGLFGASTGAAAAVLAAVERPKEISAVVSRGGRPDLARSALAAVRAPTLLIVGGFDHQVIELNREALAKLQGVKRLAIVPGATHLFEEPGTLKHVATLAGDWFTEHLTQSEQTRTIATQ